MEQAYNMNIIKIGFRNKMENDILKDSLIMHIKREFATKYNTK